MIVMLKLVFVFVFAMRPEKDSFGRQRHVMCLSWSRSAFLSTVEFELARNVAGSVCC